MDHAKNAAAYGDVKLAAVLDGTVEPPPEMQVGRRLVGVRLGVGWLAGGDGMRHAAMWV